MLACKQYFDNKLKDVNLLVAIEERFMIECAKLYPLGSSFMFWNKCMISKHANRTTVWDY